LLRVLFVVLVVFNPIQKAYTQEAISIQFGLSSFKPYSTQDPETGTCTGLAVDATKYLLESAQVTVNTSCVAPARLFRSISSGIIDLSINVKSTKSLENKVTFTKKPFDALVLNFYSNEERGNLENKVAAIRGYDYNGYRAKLVAQGYEFIEVPNGVDAIRLFTNRRTQHLLSYGGPFADYLEDKEAKRGTLEPIKITSELLASIPTHYAISKASRHHDALVEMFDKIDSESDSEYHLNHRN
jgi:polar amino acid transport system substrate-binding protein